MTHAEARAEAHASPRPTLLRGTLDLATVLGLGLVVAAAVVYWLGARGIDTGRQDFYYLADAFLDGRTWLAFSPGLHDLIEIDGRWYVPFGPFPAILFMPLVAVIGPAAADYLDTGINSLLAATALGFGWMLTGRIGIASLVHRFWLVVLFGFSTVLWWVTTKGGVWHTGQIVATVLTTACLVELWGKQRPLLVGLLAGAAFLSRAPLGMAIPFVALLVVPDQRWATNVRDWLRRVWARPPVRRWAVFALGVLPSVVFFLWYNADRFGSPFETGYGRATLVGFLVERREMGMFSLAHLPWNLELMLLHLPVAIPEFPWFRPDGLGMSVLLTSPGLLLAARARWRDARAWWLLGAAVAALLPTLLYYGGGWHQYGYRYFLDSIPFVVALCGLAVAARGLGRVGIALILFGVLVNLGGVYWVDKF